MNKKRIHNTSFVLDCGEKYMIDCPWAPAYVFEETGLSLDDVDRVIITHMHYDHVGALEMFLNYKEEKGKTVRLYTTKEIYEGVKQAIEPSLSKRMDERLHSYGEKFEELADFVELEPRKEYRENGVNVTVRENMHPVPTIGLKINNRGRTFAYSGDTKYDPELLEKLHERGAISDEQLEDLLGFLWEADFIVHEAGNGEMLHTDVKELEKLPQAVKEKIHLAHLKDDIQTELEKLEDFRCYKL